MIVHPGYQSEVIHTTHTYTYLRFPSFIWSLAI